MTFTKLSANALARKQIEPRLDALEQEIEAACRAAGRPRSDVLLLAVSKTQTAETVQAAYDCGLRQLGENYLQEALDKIQLLPKDCIWHFIGPIQSNKTRAIAEHFSWVHSVDRFKIAQRLNAQRPADLPPLNVCLQVNISEESSKAGLTAAELPALIDSFADFPRLQLRGLMCIPQASRDPQAQARPLRELRELRDRLAPQCDTLSMGMSADMEAAIAQGSTIVRIGTALFGPRSQVKAP